MVLLGGSAGSADGSADLTNGESVVWSDVARGGFPQRTFLSDRVCCRVKWTYGTTEVVLSFYVGCDDMGLAIREERAAQCVELGCS
jgi:hypothetical protein